MEPTLLVIGLSHHTASLALRERFWMGENRRYDGLRKLKIAKGIEEVVILSTCYRTDFLVWGDEPTLAANSLLQFLTAEYGLKLTEWEHFYRLLDEAAIQHVFRVVAGLDCRFLEEPQIACQIKAAGEQARALDASGRFMNAVIERALRVAMRVSAETRLADATVSIPAAVAEVSRQIFGSLQGRNLLLLGTGKVSQLSARELAEGGAGSIAVIDQSAARAKEMAETLGGRAATLADRWRCMVRADIVISATGCPHTLLTREEAERIAAERNRVPLVILDIGLPRDVDPTVRRVDGILLYDLDGLERVVEDRARERTTVGAAADKIVAAEAWELRGQLQAESGVPTMVALGRRLDEICRQELESFREERGPFTREQDQLLHAITAQIMQKIAGSLARELKELPGREEGEQMAAVLARLFHLESPQKAPAGTILEKEKNEPHTEQTIAINY